MSRSSSRMMAWGSIGATRDTGQGLGLLGMQERAALVAGTLQVESVVGRGTTVLLRVPTAAPDQAESRSTSKLGPDMAGRLRILLADDHAAVRQGLRLLIDSQPDMQVVSEAGDGNPRRPTGAGRGLDVIVMESRCLG